MSDRASEGVVVRLVSRLTARGWHTQTKSTADPPAQFAKQRDTVASTLKNEFLQSKSRGRDGGRRRVGWEVEVGGINCIPTFHSSSPCSRLCCDCDFSTDIHVLFPWSDSKEIPLLLEIVSPISPVQNSKKNGGCPNWQVLCGKTDVTRPASQKASLSL